MSPQLLVVSSWIHIMSPLNQLTVTHYVAQPIRALCCMKQTNIIFTIENLVI